MEEAFHEKCLLALALLFAVLLSGCAIVQTTDLADYGNTGGETWHGSAVLTCSPT